jgi:hypothetical protein
VTAPSDVDIGRALDVLDWLTDEELTPLRQAVDRTIRAATTRREAAGATDATPTVAWSPIEVAILWVLWATSDAVLESLWRERGGSR